MTKVYLLQSTSTPDAEPRYTINYSNPHFQRLWFAPRGHSNIPYQNTSAQHHLHPYADCKVMSNGHIPMVKRQLLPINSFSHFPEPSSTSFHQPRLTCHDANQDSQSSQSQQTTRKRELEHFNVKCNVSYSTLGNPSRRSEANHPSIIKHLVLVLMSMPVVSLVIQQ